VTRVRTPEPRVPQTWDGRFYPWVLGPWWTRPLEGEHPYVFVDARYQKMSLVPRGGRPAPPFDGVESLLVL